MMEQFSPAISYMNLADLPPIQYASRAPTAQNSNMASL